MREIPCDYCQHHENGDPKKCIGCDQDNSNFDPKYEARLLKVLADLKKQECEFRRGDGSAFEPKRESVLDKWPDKDCHNCGNTFSGDACLLDGQSTHVCLADKARKLWKEKDHAPWKGAELCDDCRNNDCYGEEYPCCDCKEGSKFVAAEGRSYDPKSRYYDHGGIEVLDIIRAKLTPEQFQGFCLGNAIKYTCRANHKGDYDRDLEKAVFYAKEAR